MRGNASLIWWPGLPQLWRQGSLRGLAEALAFSVLVNTAIGLSLMPELLPAAIRWLAWTLVAGVWLVAAVRQWRLADATPRPQVADDQGLFLQAQGEYLRGHWFEAEALLRQRLREAPQDVDAGLALASLMRRVGRAEEARLQLRRLAQLPGAQKWQMEMEREIRLLDERSEAAHAAASDAADQQDHRQRADDERQNPPVQLDATTAVERDTRPRPPESRAA